MDHFIIIFVCFLRTFKEGLPNKFVFDRNDQQKPLSLLSTMFLCSAELICIVCVNNNLNLCLTMTLVARINFGQISFMCVCVSFLPVQIVPIIGFHNLPRSLLFEELRISTMYSKMILVARTVILFDCCTSSVYLRK